jgi:hypothetical protein
VKLAGKGVSKFIIIGLFSVVLLFFVFLSSASLNVTKIYDVYTRTVTILEDGNNIAEIQLIHNTDSCFTNCEALIRISPSVQIKLPATANSDYKWDFIKALPEQAGLKSYSFEIQKSISYIVTDYSEVCNPHNLAYENGTVSTVKNCTKIETGSHIEYKISYEPFNFWSETLEAGKDYYIKLKGQKYVTLGENNIEWIPTFYSLRLNEFAWWNSNFTYCRNMEITNTLGFARTNETLNIPVSTSGWTHLPYNTSIRIVDQPCSNDGNELKSQLWNITQNSGTMDNFNVVFSLNSIPSNSTLLYSMYYENSSSTPASNYSAGVVYNNSHDIDALSYTNACINATKACATNTDGRGTFSQMTINGVLYDMVYSDTNGEPQFYWNGSLRFGEGVTATICSLQENGPIFKRLVCPAVDTTILSIFDFYPYMIEHKYEKTTNWWNVTSAYVLENRYGSDNANDLFFYDDNGAERNGTDPGGWMTARWNYTYIVHSNFGNNNRAVVYTWDSGNLCTSFKRISMNGVNMYIGNFNATGNYNWLNQTIRYTFKDIQTTGGWGNVIGLNEKQIFDNPLKLNFGEEQTENNANETAGDTAIVDGITSSVLGSSVPIYTDQQIYIRNQTGYQDQGMFDKVASSGNQRWAFNYVNGDADFENLGNITPSLYTLEIRNLPAANITALVKAFINSTKTW